MFDRRQRPVASEPERLRQRLACNSATCSMPQRRSSNVAAAGCFSTACNKSSRRRLLLLACSSASLYDRRHFAVKIEVNHRADEAMKIVIRR